MAGRLAIIREGHGEAGAVDTLVAKVGKSLGVVPSVFASLPKSQRVAITSAESAVKGARLAAAMRPDAILLTADLDDGCPATLAPAWAGAVREANLGIPSALVLFHREYETLALSVASSLAGCDLAGITLAAASPPENPETPRGAKEWISRNLMGGTRYKPTVHQLALTRLLKIQELQAAGLSSYRRLEGALTFLAGEVRDRSTGVYPEVRSA